MSAFDGTGPYWCYHSDVPRFVWYNPLLSAEGRAKMTPKMRQAVEEDRYNDGTSAGGGRLMTPNDARPANLISSLCLDGFHRPALDIDGFSTTQLNESLVAVAAGLSEWRSDLAEDLDLVALPSAKHVHVYAPSLRLAHDEYFDLLSKLVEIGLIEQGYLAASRARGQTLLRAPGAAK